MISSQGYDTDKSRAYLDRYNEFLAPLRNSPIRLLELGVAAGGSLQMWRDHFPRSTIVGLDRAPCRALGERIVVYQGDQSDAEVLGAICSAHGPFDVVIDDCGHRGKSMLASFGFLIHHLRPGGIYVVEDWCVGYRSDWEDGDGMVAAVKSLVDCCGSKRVVSEMHVFSDLVFLKKT